jgi:hypothetical protein
VVVFGWLALGRTAATICRWETFAIFVTPYQTVAFSADLVMEMLI